MKNLKEHRLDAIEQMYTDFTSLYREGGHAPVMLHRGNLAGRLPIDRITKLHRSFRLWKSVIRHRCNNVIHNS